MGVTEPSSMEGLVYFTRRKLGEAGRATAWVYKEDCPKCKKEKMGKPVDPKTKKVKSRSKEYVCKACGYTIAKDVHEPTLTMEAKYTCPHCKKEGEASGPFVRKSVKIFNVQKQKKVSTKAVRLKCQHCDGDIDITQKMK